ncbi:MAG: AAA family ATPase [Candidatus Latescibacteria bacterium]|nr:AAA family ATPase [Candidatus Latescibacterota bacterium]
MGTNLDLFESGRQAQRESQQPLAARLRPRNLDEYIGQDHILGPGRLLRRAIQADQISSLIFYGPPGTGKTTLAAVIAHTTKAHFITINAVLAGVADIRQAIDQAQELGTLHNQSTILFIDEVHRFNKAQQDALLPWVENGTVVLIGATTENPYFAVNRPLLSRSRVFQLKPLEKDDLHRIVDQSLADPRGFAGKPVTIEADALEHLVDVANGDARALLNALELAVETTPTGPAGRLTINLEVAEESIQRRAVLYDKEGDYHFDIISAFIKSLRGSDPDAALYWMARMVYAGEDPHFILRRMLIFASEDIGLADPQALQVAVAAADAFDRVGLPEGRFPLAQAALYLATAPKSNTALAFFDALNAVEKEREGEVPNHLRDASRDNEGFGHGANYLYPHAYRDHWVAQQYLPDNLQGRLFYNPSDQGHEGQLAVEVHRRRELQLAAMVETAAASEILTHSPNDQAREQWLQRTAGQFSAHLEQTRQRLFEGLQLQRHHRLLDLDASTGLLTWEALRRVPEGGVWSRCRDKATRIALQETAAHLPDLERPTVLHGPLHQLDEHLAEDDLRFDAIFGRNALGALEDKEKVLTLLHRRTASGGHLRLAETVPSQAQRLFRLVDLLALDADVCRRIEETEESIYAAADDHRVNWDGEALKNLVEKADFTQVRLHTQTERSKRRITTQQLAHWFDPGGDLRPTYAFHLGQRLSAEEVKTVKKHYERALANQTVEWSSTQIFIAARVE